MAGRSSLQVMGRSAGWSNSDMERTTSIPDPIGDPAEGNPQAGMRATVFGLDLHSKVSLSFLEGSTAMPTGRALEIVVAPSDARPSDWPRSAELVCEDHQPNGSPIYRIETHTDMGYLISGPDYGAHLLSVDGQMLCCFPEGHPEDAWQRLLIAQVLPFAALLQGLEVFHASAVVINGQAVAFVGSSGSGKTSLALELCRRGTSFLADDVLALERAGTRLLGHPGSTVAGVLHTEAETTDPSEAPVAVNARERIMRMPGVTEPAPLGALFFLDRRIDGPKQPRFEPTTNAQLLLAATFNFVLATPERLRGLLDVCALAAQLPVERIVTGPTTDASELGIVLERRLSSET